MNCIECPYSNECDGTNCLIDDDQEYIRSGYEDWEIDPDMGDH
jgi:hypothetical protein